MKTEYVLEKEMQEDLNYWEDLYNYFEGGNELGYK